MGIPATVFFYVIMAVINVWCSTLLINVSEYCKTNVLHAPRHSPLAVRVPLQANRKRLRRDHLPRIYSFPYMSLDHRSQRLSGLPGSLLHRDLGRPGRHSGTHPLCCLLPARSPSWTSSTICLGSKRSSSRPPPPSSSATFPARASAQCSFSSRT